MVSSGFCLLNRVKRLTLSNFVYGLMQFLPRKKKKRQAKHWEKIFANHMSHQGISHQGYVSLKHIKDSQNSTVTIRLSLK